MANQERLIKPQSLTTKVGRTTTQEDLLNILYAFHPDSNEVIVNVQKGPHSTEWPDIQIPESQWQTLDFTDSDLVEALFSLNSEVDNIKELINKNDDPITRTTLQYMHHIIGAALALR